MASSAQKVILVTGASRGIGKAVARFLVQDQSSNKVILCARSQEPLERIQGVSPEDVAIVVGDAGSAEVAQKCVQTAQGRWGRLDGLVLNHAILDPGFLAEGNTEAWRRTFEVNVIGIVEMIKAALPLLRKSKGRIIFTSSGAAVTGYPAWGAYGASKAALNHLALTLHEEEKDITAVSVRPGVVDTDMQRSIREEHRETMGEAATQRFVYLRNQGKLLRPEQPGNVIARLVLGAERELGGRFVSWNDESLAAFQDSK